jgi:hypothetical protein
VSVTRYLAIVGAPDGGLDAAAREALLPVCESLNLELAAAIASRFAVADDGCLHALLHRPSAAVDALVTLAEELPRPGLRCGLGWGEVGSPLRVTARGVSGPAVDAARLALGRARTRRRTVACHGWGVRRDRALDGYFTLLFAMRGSWTARQAQIVSRVRVATTQREAAAALGVRPSVVCEALAAARWREVSAAEEGARQLLEVLAES